MLSHSPISTTMVTRPSNKTKRAQAYIAALNEHISMQSAQRQELITDLAIERARNEELMTLLAIEQDHREDLEEQIVVERALLREAASQVEIAKTHVWQLCSKIAGILAAKVQRKEKQELKKLLAIY